MADGEIQFSFQISGRGTESFEVEELMIEQVRRDDFPDRVEH